MSSAECSPHWVTENHGNRSWAFSCRLRSLLDIRDLKMLSSKTLLTTLVLSMSLGVGCSTLAKRNDAGVVVARRAQIRSSTAVVAADLLEVNRGDPVEILDSVDVPDPQDNTRK